MLLQNCYYQIGARILANIGDIPGRPKYTRAPHTQNILEGPGPPGSHGNVPAYTIPTGLKEQTEKLP